jgi:hypothetical protein
MKQHIIMHDQKANQIALSIRDSIEAIFDFIEKLLLFLIIWGLGLLTGLS